MYWGGTAAASASTFRGDFAAKHLGGRAEADDFDQFLACPDPVAHLQCRYTAGVLAATGILRVGTQSSTALANHRRAA